jgi:hypothetical protein
MPLNALASGNQPSASGLARSPEHSLAFVHLGPVIPAYTRDTLRQARLFNTCPIYLVAGRDALAGFALEPDWRIEPVPSESLARSEAHREFERRSTLDRSFRDGFWTYTTERFFVLQSLMEERALRHVFHLENDVTLYVDLGQLLPVFKAHYPQLAGTFDNDQRCIPGFVYLRAAESLSPLTEFIASAFQNQAGPGINDMALLAAYRQIHGPARFGSLPIVPRDYPQPLVSQRGHQTTDPAAYSHQIEAFDSVFDAAALGQYLGGVDPRNSGGADTVGFINESCLFNPSVYTFEVIQDAAGRSIPYLKTADRAYRINNLHIHSKNVRGFVSD